MTIWRVGMRAVCVENGLVSPGCNAGWNPLCDVPRVGTTYVVRAVGKTYSGHPGIKLSGLVWRGLKDGVFYEDLFYWAGRFRPLVSRKTDISIFKEILNNPTKELEGVEI